MSRVHPATCRAVKLAAETGSPAPLSMCDCGFADSVEVDAARKHEASRARFAVKQAIAKVLAAMDDLDDATTDYEINAPEADRSIIEAVDKALNAHGYAFRDAIVEAKRNQIATTPSLPAPADVSTGKRDEGKGLPIVFPVAPVGTIITFMTSENEGHAYEMKQDGWHERGGSNPLPYGLEIGPDGLPRLAR